jgi:hypothetical protein
VGFPIFHFLLLLVVTRLGGLGFGSIRGRKRIFLLQISTTSSITSISNNGWLRIMKRSCGHTLVEHLILAFSEWQSVDFPRIARKSVLKSTIVSQHSFVLHYCHRWITAGVFFASCLFWFGLRVDNHSMHFLVWIKWQILAFVLCSWNLHLSAVATSSFCFNISLLLFQTQFLSCSVFLIFLAKGLTH